MNQIKALVLNQSEICSVCPMRIDNDLTALQKLVSGYLEVINLADGLVMVVNEEGKLRKMPKNTHATSILHAFKGPHDWIAGPAVIVAAKGDDFTSLDYLQLGKLIEIMQRKTASSSDTAESGR